MKVILEEKQFVRLISKIKDLIGTEKINPQDFILINKKNNGTR